MSRVVGREFFTDFICPICHNEEEKLLYTICNHKMCERCKSELFRSAQDQTSVLCPFCRQALRKRDIREKSIEEAYYENEINYRMLLKKE